MYYTGAGGGAGAVGSSSVAGNGCVGKTWTINSVSYVGRGGGGGGSCGLYSGTSPVIFFLECKNEIKIFFLCLKIKK